MKANGNGKGFIKLQNDFVHDEQWRSLSLGARCLLIEIWSWHNGANNGHIRYGIRHANKALKCSRRSALRWFAELQDAKLIVCIEKGSFAHKTGARKGTATAWKLTCIP